MNKKTIKRYLPTALVILILIQILLFACPFLTFTQTTNNVDTSYVLLGFALLTNKATAMNIQIDNTLIYSGATFSMSSMAMCSIVILFMMLVVSILVLVFKNNLKLKQLFYLINAGFAVILLIFMALIPVTYQIENYVFSMGYGLILSIVFVILNIAAHVVGLVLSSNSKD